MATITIIEPKTAAQSNALLLTDVYNSVELHADGLAGAEEVDVYIMGGAARVPYSVGGVPVVLTASQPNATLPPGPTYSVDKDATIAACGVYASVAADHGN
jgi:hypothetical protein